MGLMPEDERLRDQPDENYANITKDNATNELHISIPLVNYQGLRNFRQRHTKELQDLKDFNEWAKVQLDADREAFANIANKGGRRKVIYYSEDGKEMGRGWFLQFITDSRYLDAESPMDSSMVVEEEDGSIIYTDIHLTKFKDWEEKE